MAQVLKSFFMEDKDLLMINIKAAIGQATQGARASAVKALTSLPRNIPTSHILCCLWINDGMEN